MIVLATKKGDRVYEEAADETEKSKLGQKKLHPRDSCCSWIVCFSGVICLIIVLGCGYCFGIIFPVLLDVFHRGKSTTAWVGSLAFAAPGLFGPLSGRLTDQFGARAVVICGSLLAAAGLLLTSYVPSVFLMFLTYGGIYGCGSSFVYIALFEIVPRYFLRHRAMATGLMAMSSGAGFVIISPICQALLTAFGWRGAFRGLALISLIVFLLGWSFDPRVGREETEDPFGKDEKLRNPRKKGMLDFSMWRNSTFATISVLTSFIYIGHISSSLHLIQYCEELGIAEDLAVWLYSSVGLASLFARVPGAKLCEVIGSHKVYLMSSTVSAVSTFLLPLATNWIAVLCFAISYGLADGLMAIGNVLSCLQTLTMEQKAQGFGFFQLLIGAGALCGPPLGGLVADKTNSYHLAFFAAGAIEFAGIIVYALCLCLKRRRSARKRSALDGNSSFLTEFLVVDKVTVV